MLDKIWEAAGHIIIALAVCPVANSVCLKLEEHSLVSGVLLIIRTSPAYRFAQLMFFGVRPLRCVRANESCKSIDISLL